MIVLIAIIIVTEQRVQKFNSNFEHKYFEIRFYNIFCLIRFDYQLLRTQYTVEKPVTVHIGFIKLYATIYYFNFCFVK